MKSIHNLIIAGLAALCVACSDSSQQGDPDFKPKQRMARFSADNGPTVLIDEAHNNFLTADGRYKPFAQVLVSDGFRVKSNTKLFTETQLQYIDIVVIANALDRARENWRPPYGSALEQNEVEALYNWIVQGGSLFLVADHTPFPKVIENLTSALGFQFSNGHVGNATFRKENRSLAEHGITYNSKTHDETNDSAFLRVFDHAPSAIVHVKSFGGSAFKPPKKAVSLLNLGDGVESTEPEVPFEIHPDTPRRSMKGWSQGAVLELGEGRVAVFAEGMMFSSQLVRTSGQKLGLRSTGAEQNEQFLLNVMHWLADRR